MKRLSCISLSADYNVESKYIIESEEYYCSSFRSNVHLKATYYQEEDHYIFQVERSDVLLNGKKVTKLMDRFIYELGATLFPVTLKVSPVLEILDIINFDEIKDRRQKKVEEMTEKYPSNRTVEQYIRASEKNFADKNTLLHSLYQDSFCNLYFRDIYTSTADDEAKTILWGNFPKRELNRSYLYQVTPIDDSQIKTTGEVLKIIPELNGNYDMIYSLGEHGEIHHINGKITSLEAQKEYIKEISVQQTKLKTSIKQWESIIL
jgi:hypothetical protein